MNKIFLQANHEESQKYKVRLNKGTTLVEAVEKLADHYFPADQEKGEGKITIEVDRSEGFVQVSSNNDHTKVHEVQAEMIGFMQNRRRAIDKVKVASFTPLFIHYIVSLLDMNDLEFKMNFYGQVDNLESRFDIKIKLQFVYPDDIDSFPGDLIVF